MRPHSLEDYIGQDHILGPGKPLRRQIERDELTSIILWGPPGVGKTTLAHLIAHATRCEFIPFSAVLSGIKEIKAVMADAERLRRVGRRTILFVDEIHRFNKAQQDAFLPYVERGDIILIGATTENPSFEIIAALLSRSRVYALRALTVPEIVTLLKRALPLVNLRATDELLEQIGIYSNGDGRQAYNTLEAAAAASPSGELTEAALQDAMQRKVLLYDKGGEEHFNLVSALHKSVRSSDPDAALYWLTRMLEAGEDRLYIARRLVRMAIEDIGLADPRALEQCIAVKEAVHFLGIPEGDLALAQAAIYLSVAPKSDAAYRALSAVKEDVEKTIAEPVPMHLRNAPTKSMKEWGYGEGYQHAHKFENAIPDMECLPPSLAGRQYYFPTDRGIEKRIRERLEEIRKAAGGGRVDGKWPHERFSDYGGTGPSPQLLLVQFQINDGFLAGIERTEGLGAARSALEVGLEFVIHVGAQFEKVIRAVFQGNEGTDLQRLHVLELHDRAYHGAVVRIGDRTLHATGSAVFLGKTRRCAGQKQEHHQPPRQCSCHVILPLLGCGEGGIGSRRGSGLFPVLVGILLLLFLDETLFIFLVFVFFFGRFQFQEGRSQSL